MTTSVIASRYAQALFNAASGQKKTDEVKNSLLILRSVFVESGLKEVLSNPRIDRDKKQAIINKLETLIDSKLVLNMVLLLLRRNRIEDFESVGDHFERLWKEANGILTCEVILAGNPTAQFTDEITSSLKTVLKSEVDLKIKIDKRVIGGAAIKVSNRILDATIGSQLDKIRDTLYAVKI